MLSVRLSLHPDRRLPVHAPKDLENVDKSGVELAPKGSLHDRALGGKGKIFFQYSGCILGALVVVEIGTGVGLK